MGKSMFRMSYSRFLLSLAMALLLVVVSHAPTYAGSFTWSNTPIMNPEVDPLFFPKGSAVFEITGSTLELTLTYTGASSALKGVNQVNTGLLWDIDDFSGDLVPISAEIADGPGLIGAHKDYFAGADLAGAWAYRTGISIASMPKLGSYGIGAVGSVNFESTFGPGDLFGTALKVNQPNGIDFGLVPLATDDGDFTLDSLPPNQSSNLDGFKNEGPVVQYSMLFTWNIEGEDLTQAQIGNVIPIFGSDGVPIPEPSTMLLIGTGLIGLVGFRRKFKS